MKILTFLSLFGIFLSVPSLYADTLLSDIPLLETGKITYKEEDKKRLPLQGLTVFEGDTEISFFSSEAGSSRIYNTNDFYTTHPYITEIPEILINIKNQIGLSALQTALKNGDIYIYSPYTLCPNSSIFYNWEENMRECTQGENIHLIPVVKSFYTQYSPTSPQQIFRFYPIRPSNMVIPLEKKLPKYIIVDDTLFSVGGFSFWNTDNLHDSSWDLTTDGIPPSKPTWSQKRYDIQRHQDTTILFPCYERSLSLPVGNYLLRVGNSFFLPVSEVYEEGEEIRF